jgi:hypothetical protein
VGTFGFADEGEFSTSGSPGRWTARCGGVRRLHGICGMSVVDLQPLPLLLPALRSSALPREGTAVEKGTTAHTGAAEHC